jgi:hypothetical protein
MIATQEASVQIDGSAYQLINLEGHTYYFKSPRPGSSLVEIWCHRPGDGTLNREETTGLKSALRSEIFVDRVKGGCASKEGQSPEHFTFEQNPSKSAREGGAATVPKSAPRPANARSFPEGTQPSILPDAVTPTG